MRATTNLATSSFTANRREEDINSVATAVSAYTAEDRTIRGINSTQDVAAFTPGVAISDFPNRVTIRGIGRVTNTVGSDPGVANYIDGFYTSESDVIGSSDFLTARVEILRGPQGTLYGRNSIGGAVNVISKRPTREFQVEARASINDYERYGAAASISGPISDTIRFRLAAIGATQDQGYIRNLSGPDQWTDERSTIEGQLEADITPNLNAWVRVVHTAYSNRPQPNVTVDPFTDVPYFGGLVANPQFGLATNPSLNDPFTVSYDFGGRQKLRNNVLATTNITLDTPEVIVRLIGGYAQYDYSETRDLDQTARTSFRVPAFGTTFPVSSNYVSTIGENKRWYSSELNFLSAPGGDFDWIVGMYYYHEKLDQPVAFGVPDVALFDNPVELGVPAISNPQRAYYYQRGRLQSTALAAFGQVTWRFTPTLSLEVGGRYSYDQKRGLEDQFQVFYDVQVDPGNTYGVVNASRNLRGNWGSFTGNIGLNFQPSDATLAYAKVSRGYKSGGFTLGALAPVPEVDPEHVTAFELGLKQQLGPVQWNSAAFYYDYTDLQVVVNQLIGTPPISRPVFFSAPKARTFGFETEVNVCPIKPLSLNAIYSFLDTKFVEFTNVIDVATATATPQDLRGNDLPQSPRNKLTLNGVVTAGPFDLSVTQTFVASQYFAVFNTPAYRAPAYDETALRLTYTAPGERFRLIGSVTNLFDNTSFSYVTTSAFANGSLRSVAPRLPRIFSLEARVKF